MWRFHRIHHSDPFVDVTTTRTHPVETVAVLFGIVPIWLLGFPRRRWHPTAAAGDEQDPER
jgi:sterol desaturase/sphingolipid hydroxylase (fatty acid hydroxylase superfamily)